MKFVTAFVSTLLLSKKCLAYQEDTFSVKLENWNSGIIFLNLVISKNLLIGRLWMGMRSSQNDRIRFFGPVCKGQV